MKFFLPEIISIYENNNLCADTAMALETQLRLNGFTGTADIYENTGNCNPEIISVTTNQGHDQSSIALDNGTCIPFNGTDIIWTTRDPGFVWTLGDWTSRHGIEHTYFSYRLDNDTVWQPGFCLFYYGFQTVKV